MFSRKKAGVLRGIFFSQIGMAEENIHMAEKNCKNQRRLKHQKEVPQQRKKSIYNVHTIRRSGLDRWHWTKRFGNSCVDSTKVRCKKQNEIP